MTKKIMCDRCGAIIGSCYVFLSCSTRDLEEDAWNFHNDDLCPNCYEDFERFMAMENVITNEMAVE